MWKVLANSAGTLGTTIFLTLCGAPAATAEEADRRALFGDLHVHTRYSFDAFIFGTRTTPDDAYEFAKGKAIEHPGGFELQLDRPLDFLAVTDHANYLGMLEAMSQPDHPLSKLDRAADFTQARTISQKRSAFRGGAYIREHRDVDVIRSAWKRTVEAAERHNAPGAFTTFPAYEYTSSREGGNLHRNVIFRGDAVPDYPYGRGDSINPEDLWAWMDDLRLQGIEALAIPHNSNGSDGHMFQLVNFAGEPIDAAYAETRMRNEPLVEVTQVKGTSDTHPFLSPNDEWADFEIMPYRIAQWNKSRPRGSYVRDAYQRGLKLQTESGVNPYRFGLVGASDTHNGGASLDESNFVAKVGILDATAELRGSVSIVSEEGITAYNDTYYKTWSASGLAGVWAEENTRDSIYDAFRRKETFATSGPRIVVRIFAGDYPDDLANRDDVVDLAYAEGVPMGGELPAGSDGAASPRFLVWALQDPLGTPLQRVQVIKGWSDDGHAKEQVFDVACSDGGTPDPETHRCPDNGAEVDLSDCSITPDRGASELVALWRDPDFGAGQHAFYYLRALENPTCRWSTWDAVKAGVDPRPGLQATIQERAWSSPIWIGGPPTQ